MKSRLFVMAALMAASVPVAHAQGFTPSRPIDFLVHTGPGAGSDLFARGVAGVLEKNKLVPQRIQIANRTGGGGLVAMSFLGEKAGEDHMVAFFTSVWYVNPMIRKEAKVSMKELTPGMVFAATYRQLVRHGYVPTEDERIAASRP